jgi:hypothetical protein
MSLFDPSSEWALSDSAVARMRCKGAPMPHDMMVRCERRTQYKIDGRYEWRWKEVDVAEMPTTSPRKIRCLYCHGAVRVHRQQIPQGPRDHVEHRSRRDSEGCPGGHYFQGIARLSSNPIE